MFQLADLSKLVGAAHGFEIPFVFGHWELGPMTKRLFDAENAAGREKLGAEMASYWAEFARTGAPGRGRQGDLPEWSAWSDASAQSPRTMVLDTPAGGGLRMISDTVTEEGVIAAIDDDPRLATQRDRCAVYWRIARFGRGFDAERYASAGSRSCAGFPIAGYPWAGEAEAAGG